MEVSRELVTSGRARGAWSLQARGLPVPTARRTTVTECKRVRLSGTVKVALSPEEAFSLFTAQGMSAWRPSWEPWFPVEGNNLNEPGTVFQTEHNGDVSTWVVVRCEPELPIVYARGKLDALAGLDIRAGMVTITLDRQVDGLTEATIGYDLTTLKPEYNAGLDQYAAQYQQMLTDWEESISRVVTERYAAV
jgi:hypothetical protein